MTRASGNTRKVVGLGFLPRESRHGFLVDIPKGTSTADLIRVTEHRGDDLGGLGERETPSTSANDASLRVVIDRSRWLALAPAFWEEANRRLRANGLTPAKYQKNPSKPV